MMKEKFIFYKKTVDHVNQALKRAAKLKDIPGMIPSPSQQELQGKSKMISTSRWAATRTIERV